MPKYRVAPIFLIRAAGVPFDVLERLSTRGASALARELLRQRDRLSKSRARAEEFLGSRDCGLSAEASRSCRTTLRTGRWPNGSIGQPPPAIAQFLESARVASSLAVQLEETLAGELEAARANLSHAGEAILPPYLLFSAGEFSDRLSGRPSGDATLPPRNARTRERERHLLLYLQRVCAKNDTFSEFGPSAWGRSSSAAGVSFSPGESGGKREAFLERWTAHALASALNRDPETRLELSPRLNPNGRLTGNSFLLTENGETVPLTQEAYEIAVRCDGTTPAHSLGAARDLLDELAAHRVILWEAEVPAMEPHAFNVLVSDLEHWRESAVRTRWLERCRKIAALPEQFAAAGELRLRAEIMANARRLISDLGGEKVSPGRFLYAASNPIAEECSREPNFFISEAMTDELTRDVEPWLDLWRDTYAFVASRVAAGLRGMLQTAPVENGTIPLPAFLLHCARNKMPLTGHGLVIWAHLAFQEVKAAFRQMVSKRPDAPEWELSAEDCAFVRNNFDYPKYDEYTYPSADLQLSASSFAALNRGEYQWVVSELHPPVALLHHALYWSCPDKAALSEALARTTLGRPSAHFGLFAADFTAHTTVRQFDALPELTTFVSAQRANPRWRTVPPAEVEVFIEESTGDVALRKRGSHEYLGSFARSWVIPLGFHPFHFGRASHMPRLRCGQAIVQRRTWTVALDEFKPVDHLLLAIERLRSEKGWPRYIYMRPTEAGPAPQWRGRSRQGYEAGLR